MNLEWKNKRVSTNQFQLNIYSELNLNFDTILMWKLAEMLRHTLKTAKYLFSVLIALQKHYELDNPNNHSTTINILEY